MSKMLIIASGLMLVATPVAAQVTSLETGNPTSKGKGDPNRMVCEVEQTTGTRLGARKVCKTRLEWEQLRAEHRATLESVQRQATSTGIPQT